MCSQQNNDASVPAMTKPTLSLLVDFKMLNNEIGDRKNARSFFEVREIKKKKLHRLGIEPWPILPRNPW
jgi:hypothetical protein